jgi:hypothetical protein
MVSMSTDRPKPDDVSGPPQAAPALSLERVACALGGKDHDDDPLMRSNFGLIEELIPIRKRISGNLDSFPATPAAPPTNPFKSPRKYWSQATTVPSALRGGVAQDPAQAPIVDASIARPSSHRGACGCHRRRKASGSAKKPVPPRKSSARFGENPRQYRKIAFHGCRAAPEVHNERLWMTVCLHTIRRLMAHIVLHHAPLDAPCPRAMRRYAQQFVIIFAAICAISVRYGAWDARFRPRNPRTNPRTDPGNPRTNPRSDERTRELANEPEGTDCRRRR